MSSELDGAEIFENWDQLIQSPESAESDSLEELVGLDLVGQTSKGEEYWEDLFHKFNFPGMNLSACHYYPVTIHETDFFSLYTAAKKTFIREIADHNINDLRIAGFSEENIFYLSKGILPANWTVHLKVPPLYGGQPDSANMVLMQIQPFHERVHDFLNAQILTEAGVGHPKVLYVPMPTEKIYVPVWGGGQMGTFAGVKK